jgi:hypothetical protein
MTARPKRRDKPDRQSSTSSRIESNDGKTTGYPVHDSYGAGLRLIGLHQSIRSHPADDWWRPHRGRKRGCNRGGRSRWAWCGPWCCRGRSGRSGGRPRHYATAAAIPLILSPAVATALPHSGATDAQFGGPELVVAEYLDSDGFGQRTREWSRLRSRSGSVSDDTGKRKREYASSVGKSR